MTTSIHLEMLRVSGWKGIKEPVEIDFGDRSWLIHGPNESGKSSLFSALRFALFEEAGTRGAWSGGWIHNASAGAEVEVALRIDGEPYTIVKNRGARSGTTWLYAGIGPSRRQLDVRNKDADHRILELIGAARRRGRDAEVPSRWGLLAWLLAPQSMDTVAEARRHSTEALGLGRAISPEFQRVRERVLAFVATNFGRGGSPLKKSEITEARAPVERLERERVELLEARARFERVLEEIEGLEAGLPALRRALDQASDRFEEGRHAEVDFTAEEGRLRALEHQRSRAEAELEARQRELADLAALDGEIAGLDTAIGEHTRRVGKLEARAAHALEKVGRLAEEMDRTAGARDRAIERAGRLRELLAAREHTARLQAVRDKLRRLAELQAALGRIEARGDLLSEAEIDRQLRLAADLEQAEALLANLARERGVSVRLDGELKATWIRDGLEVVPEGELDFAAELRILADDFALTLRFAPQQGETDWLERRRALAAEVSGRGHAGPAELRAAMNAQRERAREHTDLVRERKRVGEAPVLRAELEKLEASSVAELAEDTPPADQLSAEAMANQEEIEELGGRLRKLQADRTRAEKQSSSHRGELEQARAELKTARAQRVTAGRRRDAALERSGGKGAREAALGAVAAELERLAAELDRARRSLEMNRGTHLEELKRLGRVKRAAERDLRNRQVEIRAAHKEATQLGGRDLHARLLAIDEELHVARERLGRVRRHAEAMARLAARLGRVMTEATIVETAPIRERVQRWLSLITTGHWTMIEMNGRLEVTRLSGAPPEIAGEGLGSAGLRQLIHALTRLAVAVKLYEDGLSRDPAYPPVALVMDESQSHVDAGRVGRLMHVFNEEIGAGRVQVVALSHRRDEFQNLEAMNYDIVRREAYDPDLGP